MSISFSPAHFAPQMSPGYGRFNPEPVSNTFNSVGGDMTQLSVTSYGESGAKYQLFYSNHQLILLLSLRRNRCTLPLCGGRGTA